jgi:AcrR family transcriptional regulator
MARTRRRADEARRAILEAAEKRLREGGPEAVRLQEVAADLGVSHPAILHHFGSRDGLMRALAGRVATRIEEEVLEGLRRAASEETAEELLVHAFDTVADLHARLFAWRTLAGDEPAERSERPALLSSLTDLVHARRGELARHAGRPAPTREDSEFLVRLGAAAMLGEGIGGAAFDRSLGRSGEAARSARRRFRAFVARLLIAHEELSPPRRAAPGSRPAGPAHPRGRARAARR